MQIHLPYYRRSTCCSSCPVVQAMYTRRVASSSYVYASWCGVWVVRSKIMCNASTTSTYGWCQCFANIYCSCKCKRQRVSRRRTQSKNDWLWMIQKGYPKDSGAYLYLLHKIQKMSGCGWKNIQSSFMKVQTADGHWLRSSLCSSGPHLLKIQS